MAVGEILKLRLESIESGGDALGRLNGKPVFIEGGAPDETVLCRLTEDRKTWARAQLLEIIEPSPVRIDSMCEFYGKCGGCNLQHIDYETQLSVKTGILKNAFLKIAGIQPPEPEVFSSLQWEYRNRMQFHISRQYKNKQTTNSFKYGFKKRQSEEIIFVSDCPVAVPGIKKLLNTFPSSLSLPPEKDRFTVFSKDDVLLNEGGVQRGKIKLAGKEIILDAEVFFQSNCFMLEKLIYELQKIADTADHNLPMADFYCGVGTFALFLGDKFPKIILAEENKKAVSITRENLKGKNTDFFAIRDTDWPQSILKQKNANKGFEFGLAVFDPPRAGLNPKLAEVLAQNGPPVLAYVSCDAASLARDSKILIKGGYKLDKLSLFDFYPQTAHIESLAVFVR
jgi:23S rRNA (uracil1939-C5)-methyltransferase